MAIKTVFQTNAVQANAYQGDTTLPSTIVIESESSGFSASTTSHSITMPSGVTAGDYLVAFFSYADAGINPTVTGWTQITSTNDSTANFVFNAYRKVAVGGDTLTIGITTSVGLTYYVARLSGIDTSHTPVITTLNNDDNNKLDVGSVATTWGGQEGIFFVAGFALYNSAGQSPTIVPGSYIEDFSYTALPGQTQSAWVGHRTQINQSGSENPAGVNFYRTPTGGAFSRNFNASAFVVGFKGTSAPEMPASIIYDASPDVAVYAYEDLHTNYGTEVQPAIAEETVVEPTIYSDPAIEVYELDDNWGNWSWSQAPPVDDNNPEVAPSALDDQDFTDLADYSFTVDPLSSDNNPDVAPAAIALDDQDFTDFTDYGFNQNAPTDLDEQDPDLSLIDYDSQDFTDYTDYSYTVDPAIEDNNPDLAPSALDEQDFTDYTDYSFVLYPTIEDFTLVEDFSLGLGLGLDEQDFTDTAEYGFFVEPLADNTENFNLGTGAGLDDQDFTDTADYGFNINPPIDDNNPEVAVSAVALDDQDFTDTADYGFNSDPAIPDSNPDLAPSALDDQDFTDTADYGFNSDPAIPDNNPDLAPSALDDQDFTDTADYSFVNPVPIDDNNPDVCVAAIALDDQDFTDTADYSYVLAPLSDQAPDDFLLGTGLGLDDQDFTDREDYSYITPVLSEDRGEDFPLGKIYDSNDEIVNYFDLSDYSYIVQPNFNDTSVLLPSFTVYVLPSDACQLVVITWNYTTEPSPSWSEITQPSSSWSEVAQPAASWLDINEPSASWTIIIDATEINWNQVC